MSVLSKTMFAAALVAGAHAADAPRPETTMKEVASTAAETKSDAVEEVKAAAVEEFTTVEGEKKSDAEKEVEAAAVGDEDAQKEVSQALTAVLKAAPLDQKEAAEQLVKQAQEESKKIKDAKDLKKRYQITQKVLGLWNQAASLVTGNPKATPAQKKVVKKIEFIQNHYKQRLAAKQSASVQATITAEQEEFAASLCSEEYDAAYEKALKDGKNEDGAREIAEAARQAELAATKVAAAAYENAMKDGKTTKKEAEAIRLAAHKAELERLQQNPGMSGAMWALIICVALAVVAALGATLYCTVFASSEGADEEVAVSKEEDSDLESTTDE